MAFDAEKFAEQLAQFGRQGRQGRQQLQNYLDRLPSDSDTLVYVDEAIGQLEDLTVL